MEILLTPEKWVIDSYPEDEKLSSYKLSNYIIEEEYEDKILIIHTTTWAIYALSKEEYDNILNNEILKENKVIVPINLNEDEIAHNVYLKRMTPKNLPTFDKIKSCVILTTTACNARCAYCYENNIKKKEIMSLETAEKVVQYLKEKHEGIKSPLKIQWFGGEPLLNQTVIDYIISRFNELEIPYISTIISNGYLFNDETIDKLDNWHLKNAQITLDGIADDYNNAKNYIYSDVDAFLTVIDNIHKIVNKTNATITIRINVSNENVFNIYNAIEYIKDEFKEEIADNKINIYVRPLFDILNEPTNGIDGFWEEIERISTIASIPPSTMCDIELRQDTFKRHLINSCCMAFNKTSIVILPNGLLAPCEHIKDEDIYGHIISGITNIDVVNKWYTFDGPQIDYCKKSKCPLQPICPRFFNCEEDIICHEKSKIDRRVKMAKEKLIRTYNFWRNNQNN